MTGDIKNAKTNFALFMSHILNTIYVNAYIHFDVDRSAVDPLTLSMLLKATFSFPNQRAFSISTDPTENQHHTLQLYADFSHFKVVLVLKTKTKTVLLIIKL